MKKRFETFCRAVVAGFAIGIGATVFLSCENKTVGAVMFSVGLFAICSFGLDLFTGKIGHIFDTKNDPDCFVIWLGNFVGCAFTAVTMRFAKPALYETASAMITKKLSIPLPFVFILGIFCGMLMYIAVDNYKKNSSGFGKNIGIFFCVPAFILCGFEHSVADMAYFAYGISSFSQVLPSLLFIITVSLGNAAGAFMFRYISGK